MQTTYGHQRAAEELALAASARRMAAKNHGQWLSCIEHSSHSLKRVAREHIRSAAYWHRIAIRLP